MEKQFEDMANERKKNMNAEVFHDIRGSRIFLCINGHADPSTVNGMIELSKSCYAVERELLPDTATKDGILKLIAGMEAESGLSLTPSKILCEELGL